MAAVADAGEAAQVLAAQVVNAPAKIRGGVPTLVWKKPRKI